MIGPGKALDTDKYFIIATDAISNGFTTSPSNSQGAAADAVPQIHGSATWSNRNTNS